MSFTFGFIMIVILRYILLLTGLAVLSWNLSAVKLNKVHTEKVESHFGNFRGNHMTKESDHNIEFYDDFNKLELYCTTTDGLYGSFDKRVHLILLCAVLLIGGFLSFLVKSKKVAEQV